MEKEITAAQFLATGLCAALDNAWDMRLENQEGYAINTIYEDVYDGEPDSLTESGYLCQDGQEKQFSRKELREAYEEMAPKIKEAGLEAAIDEIFKEEKSCEK